MSAADHPNWLWLKKQVNEPSRTSKFVAFVLRVSILMLVYFLTNSLIWFYITLFASSVLPNLLFALIDFRFRKPTPVQFSLQAMLIAILTLQIPVMLFFTAEDGIGIGLGVSLLLIWLLVFGAYVKIRLAIAKEDSAERAALEKRQEMQTVSVGESK